MLIYVSVGAHLGCERRQRGLLRCFSKLDYIIRDSEKWGDNTGAVPYNDGEDDYNSGQNVLGHCGNCFFSSRLLDDPYDESRSGGGYLDYCEKHAILTVCKYYTFSIREDNEYEEYRDQKDSTKHGERISRSFIYDHGSTVYRNNGRYDHEEGCQNFHQEHSCHCDFKIRPRITTIKLTRIGGFGWRKSFRHLI
jgi:hypothetical protein